MTPVSSFINSIRAKFKNVRHPRERMHQYQGTSVQFLLDNPFSALFIDCGMGKTVISLTTILELVKLFQTTYTLIIAPVRVANETWPTEIAEWQHTAPLSYAHIRDADLTERVNAAGDIERKTILAEAKARLEKAGKTAKEIKADLSELRKADLTIAAVEDARLAESKLAVRDFMKRAKATIHIINREQVEFLVNAWGRDWPYDTVFIDESSAFKDHTTKRFEALKRVRPLMKRLHELTATPVAESYLHLFAQIYLLDRGERLGRNITAYRNEYFTHNEYTRTYTLREGAKEKITAKISDICLVMRAEDYLDMEHPTFVKDKIELSAEERKMYDEMEQQFAVTLADGHEVVAETAAAKSQKLQQIASGVVYETILTPDEYGEHIKSRVVHHIHDHKIDKLRQIREDSEGEPLLVAYILKSSLERIKKAFPKAVVMDSQGKCIPDWNKGKIDMLLFSPKGAAHGLNLQHGGRRMVFFDIPWSLELFYQAWKRLARQGQKLAVIVHLLLVNNSIDEEIADALTDKDMTQEEFFRLVKRMQKKY